VNASATPFWTSSGARFTFVVEAPFEGVTYRTIDIGVLEDQERIFPTEFKVVRGDVVCGGLSDGRAPFGEPVNETIFTIGSAASAWPATGPRPGTTWSTSGGST
jgi:hypothetical protein